MKNLSEPLLPENPIKYREKDSGLFVHLSILPVYVFVVIPMIVIFLRCLKWIFLWILDKIRNYFENVNCITKMKCKENETCGNCTGKCSCEHRNTTIDL